MTEAIVAAPTTITIQKQDGGYKVSFGDRWADGLTPDEALWTVAVILLKGEATPYLRTQAEWDRWEKRLSKIEAEAKNDTQSQSETAPSHG